MAATVRSLRTPAFQVCDHTLAAGYHLGRHTHAAPGLVLGLEGLWVGTLGRREHACGPGDVVVLPDAATHREQAGRAGARCLLVSLVADDGSFGPATRLFERDRHVAAGAAALARRVARALTHPTLVEGLLVELVAALHRDPAPPRADPAWLRRVRDELDARCLDDVDLGGLAVAAGRSREHAYRSFRRAFGTSPGGYLRERRLERAAQLLAGGTCSLAAVAQECGFADQSHFTNRFRERFGVTPARYRRARR